MSLSSLTSLKYNNIYLKIFTFHTLCERTINTSHYQLSVSNLRVSRAKKSSQLPQDFSGILIHFETDTNLVIAVHADVLQMSEHVAVSSHLHTECRMENYTRYVSVYFIIDDPECNLALYYDILKIKNYSCHHAVSEREPYLLTLHGIIRKIIRSGMAQRRKNMDEKNNDWF